jgi:hypothetical protein
MMAGLVDLYGQPNGPTDNRGMRVVTDHRAVARRAWRAGEMVVSCPDTSAVRIVVAETIRLAIQSQIRVMRSDVPRPPRGITN